MSKFKIGDTIHYMSANKPESRNVIGICTIEGKVETSGIKEEAKENENIKLYFTGFYSSVKEHEAFSSLEELKQSLFK